MRFLLPSPALNPDTALLPVILSVVGRFACESANGVEGPLGAHRTVRVEVFQTSKTRRGATRVEILRLRVCFALRSKPSAQDAEKTLWRPVQLPVDIGVTENGLHVFPGLGKRDGLHKFLGIPVFPLSQPVIHPSRGNSGCPIANLSQE